MQTSRGAGTVRSQRYPSCAREPWCQGQGLQVSLHVDPSVWTTPLVTELILCSAPHLNMAFLDAFITDTQEFSLLNKQ